MSTWRCNYTVIHAAQLGVSMRTAVDTAVQRAYLYALIIVCFAHALLADYTYLQTDDAEL